MIRGLKLHLRLLWNQLQLYYAEQQLKALMKTANTILDRTRAKYPELCEDDDDNDSSR